RLSVDIDVNPGMMRPRRRGSTVFPPMSPQLRPRLLDAAIAAALCVAGQLNLWLGFDGYYGGGPRALNVVLTAIVTLSLAWRRSAPVAVLTTIFLAFPVARALGAGMTFWGDFVPLFVIAGTVAAEERGRRRYLAVCVP